VGRSAFPGKQSWKDGLLKRLCRETGLAGDLKVVEGEVQVGVNEAIAIGGAEIAIAGKISNPQSAGRTARTLFLN
jgi:hypothetical protein